MKIVDIHEAKTDLSRIVAAGDEVIIARDGKPVARLLPITPRNCARHPGQWRGQVQIGGDFDAPLPSALAAALGAGE